MQDRLRAIMWNIQSASSRMLRQIVSRLDPVEREFRQLWPLINSIEGQLVSPVQELWLFKTAKSLNNDATIVEIGSLKGRSTCSMAYGCRGTNKHVFAIDTFEVYLNDFKCNLEKCGLSAYVTPIPDWSTEVAKIWNKPIHFLFIDGAQEYEDVLADFENFFPHVVPGGIIALHDVHTWLDGPVGYPGVLRVWQEVASLVLDETGVCSTIAFGKKASWQVGETTPGGNGSILLVGDNELYVRVGQAQLKCLGYSVTGYTQSQEALEVFRAAPERFDLVMTAQSMPDMPGEALADQVRRLRPDIPIILCADCSHTIDAEKAQALDINVFSPKPTGLHELGVAIRRILAQQSYVE